MSVQEMDTLEITNVAYQEAWEQFRLIRNLCPDERASGPQKLRQYIESLVATGERDPVKIAFSALGLLREYEQISRSKASIDVRSALED